MIPNAYVPRPGQRVGDLRAELGVAPEVPLVGTAAVFRPQKALEVMLEAFALVAADHPDARFVMAGDGEHRGRGASWRSLQGGSGSSRAPTSSACARTSRP